MKIETKYVPGDHVSLNNNTFTITRITTVTVAAPPHTNIFYAGVSNAHKYYSNIPEDDLNMSREKTE
jgi:hypothetical protein